MPRRCSVFGCKTNYDSQAEHATTFSFPKDPELRKKWIAKIPTDLSKLKNPVVCIKHFADANIIRSDTVTYKGELKEYPRVRPKLRENAVPTVFQNAPKYLTVTEPNVKRLADVEQETYEAAVRESLLDYKAYEEKNKIACLSDIEIFVQNRQNADRAECWTVLTNVSGLCLCFVCIVPGSVAPTIKGSIFIEDNLHFRIFMHEIPISKSQLPVKCDKLDSQNHLNELMEFVEAAETNPHEKKLEAAIALLKESEEYADSERMQFLVEQITLEETPPNARRYGNQTMVLSSCMYVHSSAAYGALRKCGLLLLPHPRNLQKLVCNFKVNAGMDGSIAYLKCRKSQLKEHELLVSLVLDEIYLQPQMSFKGGEIYGSSAFDGSKRAKTAQVFMISSVFSKYKDVVSIVPINTLTSEQLRDMILVIIENVERIGFKTIAFVSDNNAVNRKAFELLSPEKILKPSISHPSDPSRKIFIIFDTVHLLKCIRNNWETKKNLNRSIRYLEKDKIVDAQYKHLELMYESEKKLLVKYGHTLSHKVLYPSNIQKQNVKLALKIFNDNNVTALKHVAQNDCDRFGDVSATCSFISIFVRWWKIVNVKSMREATRFNDPDREAVKSETGTQMQFLREFALWLKNWRLTVPIKDALSAQTFQALIQTTDAYLELVPYIFEVYHPQYILLSKFQSDCLEGRFSNYRQLSGANYYVSFVQILENEKKMRFQNAVLFSIKQNNQSLKDFIPSSQTVSDLVTLEDFAEVVNEDIEFNALPQDTLAVLTYITGYAVKNTLKHNSCSCCVSWLQLDKTIDVDESYELVKELDRGKLTFPSENAVHAVAIVWFCMKQLSEKYFSAFVQSGNQLAVLRKLSEVHLQRLDWIAFDSMCACEETLLNKLEHIIKISSKVMLNNFVKMLNDENEYQNDNLRKIKKLKSSVL